MTKTTTRYIVPWSTGRWVIYCQSGSRAQNAYETREAAIWDGRHQAGTNRPSVLRVCREDGSVEAEFLYH